MLFVLPASILALLAASVTAQPHDNLISSLTARQSNAPSNDPDCNATCGASAAVKQACSVPHCGCTVPFLQAQGACLVCQTDTPGDAAAVQFLLDAEIAQCHSEKIPVEYQIPLPPAAQAIVRRINQQSAELRQQQTGYLALQIAGGHVGLVVVLIFAVFSRKVRRDPTFLNFCITWTFSSIVFSILLYRGTDGNTVANSLGEVPPMTCLAQAALTNGAQVMTACSTMALVIQLWLGLRAAIHGDPVHGLKQGQWTTTMLLVAPYILFIAFALPTIFVGQTQISLGGTLTQRTLPTNFYCSVVELDSFLQGIYGVTLVLLIITVVFDVLIIGVLYRHWWAFRHVQTKSAVSLSILLRVMIFSIYRVVVAVAYGTVLNKPPQIESFGATDALAVTFGVPAWVDMLQAAIPLIGFLVLGVNSDMINALMFWRRRRSDMSTVQSVNTAGISTVNSTWNEKAILEGDTRYVNVEV